MTSCRPNGRAPPRISSTAGTRSAREHRASEASVRGTPPSAHSPTHKRAATAQEAPWLAPTGPRVCTPLLNLPVPVGASQRWARCRFRHAVCEFPQPQSSPGVQGVSCKPRPAQARVLQPARTSMPPRRHPAPDLDQPQPRHRRDAVRDRRPHRGNLDRRAGLQHQDGCHLHRRAGDVAHQLHHIVLARPLGTHPAPHIHVTCSMLHPANRRAIGTKVPRVLATVAASADRGSLIPGGASPRTGR